MCCIVALWLHLRARVSRQTCGTILRCLQVLLTITFAITSRAIQTVLGADVQLTPPRIPTDIRTAAQMQRLDPCIIRYICCSKCFTVYPDTIQSKTHPTCTWKESPRSCECGNSLWTNRQTSKGPKRVPKTLYSTQSLDNWLQFFLGRSAIEDALIRSFHDQQRNRRAFGGEMRDVHDSPAWQTLQGNAAGPYNLVFGLYVDWFNPLTNRIAGMFSYWVCKAVR